MPKSKKIGLDGCSHVGSHHPPRFSAFLPGIAFSAKKSARIVKTAPDAGKKQENKHAAANKSEERKIR